ncbi:MAG: ribosome recycling factor [bacterium]
MAYDFSQLKTRIKDTEEWLKKELTGIRTGRANMAVLDTIQVEMYGSYMPVNQLANIALEDVRTLRIAPWDNTASKAIEKAINNSNLGLSTAVDDKGIRLFFPELTGERRAMLVKVAKEKMEDARVALRKERESAWSDVQVKEKEGVITEDDKFRAKDEMQKYIDEGNNNLVALFVKKEQEILN